MNYEQVWRVMKRRCERAVKLFMSMVSEEENHDEKIRLLGEIRGFKRVLEYFDEYEEGMKVAKSKINVDMDYNDNGDQEYFCPVCGNEVGYEHQEFCTVCNQELGW